MTTNNYILARWRDASTDPPVAGWIGLNTMANGSRYYGACGYMPGDQWLDITAIPGVPREVCSCPIFIPGSMDINNRIMLSEVHYAEPYGQPPWRYCPWCGGTVWQAVTGVTPAEVQS